MSSRRNVQVFFILLAVTVGLQGAEPKRPAAERERKNNKIWESAILEFERQDKVKPTPPGGIVFVGSSTIRMWDLSKSFPDLPVLNRGFGGSQAVDSAHYAERLVIKHRPRFVVFYAGDNDIAFGKPPEQVCDDFIQFAGKVHKELPETKIIFLSIKPSFARWKLLAKQQRTNDLVRSFIGKDKRLQFLDIGPVLLGPDGKPRADLLLPDGLHLNPAGYKLVSELLGPHLK